MALRASLVLLALLVAAPVSARRTHERVPRTHAVVAEPIVNATDATASWRVVMDPAALRVLRGDWEIPDALVVTFTPYWADALSVLIKDAARSTPVIMLAGRHDDIANVRAVTQTWGLGERVQVVPTSAETPWVRDYGPLQVFDDGELTWLDFAYESTRIGDDIVPQALAAETRVQVEAWGPSIDGGGIVGNGGGLCVITDRTLAVAGVDAHDEDAVHWVSEHLGCPALAIIPGLEDEPTGHADMLAQFFAPDRVGVASLPAKQFPEESAALDASARILASTAERAGIALRIVRVPMHIDSNGVYFSYLNGARIGPRFFVPSYEQVDPRLQAEAYARLASLLGGDAMVFVPSDAMAELGGAIHCVTLGLSLR